MYMSVILAADIVVGMKCLLPQMHIQSQLRVVFHSDSTELYY